MKDIQRIVTKFEVKSFDTDDNFFYFKGYASTFGNIDRYDDIVEKGAFLKTINELKAKGETLPILWQHQSDVPLGVYTDIFEDEKGLFVVGKMPKDDDFVKGRVMPQLKAGTVKKLSIGFRITGQEFKEIDGRQIRIIKEVNLLEVSLATIPANTQADITDVKHETINIKEQIESIGTVKGINDFLEDKGLSRTEREGIIAKTKSIMKKEKSEENSDISNPEENSGDIDKCFSLLENLKNKI